MSTMIDIDPAINFLSRGAKAFVDVFIPLGIWLIIAEILKVEMTWGFPAGIAFYYAYGKISANERERKSEDLYHKFRNQPANENIRATVENVESLERDLKFVRNEVQEKLKEIRRLEAVPAELEKENAYLRNCLSAQRGLVTKIKNRGFEKFLKMKVPAAKKKRVF